MDITNAAVIAAGIAAIAAMVVALTNGWFARRLARDTAHRAYRQALADSALDAVRALLGDIRQLETLARRGDFDSWRKLVSSINAHHYPRIDRRTAQDPVFREAVTVFRRRRGQLGLWLTVETFAHGRVITSAPFGMTQARLYIEEIADIVNDAAEAYTFGLTFLRLRTRRRLRALDQRPLKIRIDERLAVYERAFGDATDTPVDDSDEWDIPVEKTEETH